MITYHFQIAIFEDLLSASPNKSTILWVSSLMHSENETTHPTTRRRGDVVTTFLCTSQWRRRYVSNETPNNVSVERRENMSVVGLRGVLLICRDDVSWERNDDVPSVRLHDVSNTSQTANDVSVVRHQDISVVRIYYVPLARHYNVFCNSQMKHPIRSLWYVWTRSRSYVVERPCL